MANESEPTMEPVAQSQEKARRKIGERKFTADQIHLIEELFSKGFTASNIAEQLGAPLTSVRYYTEKLARNKEEVAELAAAAMRPERTPERLRELILTVPGIGDAKANFVVQMFKASPVARNNPQAVANLLFAMGLTPQIVDYLVQAFFSEFFQAGGIYGGGGQGMPQYPAMGPGAQAPQYGQPMGYQMPQAPPQFQSVPGPYGGVQYVPVGMPGAGQRGMGAEDVRRLVDESREQDYVEEENPVIGPDGKPVVGADGVVIMRRVRRPASQGLDPMAQMIQMATLMKMMQPAAPAQPASDPALLATVQSLRDGMSQMRSQMEAATLRAELQAQFGSQLNAKDREVAGYQLQARIAEMKMKPEDQATIKVVDSGSKVVEKAMENTNKRFDRIATLLEPIAQKVIQDSGAVQPPAGGPMVPVAAPPSLVPVAASDADLERLAAAAQAAGTAGADGQPPPAA